MPGGSHGAAEGSSNQSTEKTGRGQRPSGKPRGYAEVELHPIDSGAGGVEFPDLIRHLAEKRALLGLVLVHAGGQHHEIAGPVMSGRPPCRRDRGNVRQTTLGATARRRDDRRQMGLGFKPVQR